MQSWCKECAKAANAVWYALNREKTAAHYTTNREQIKSRQAAYRVANTDKIKDRHSRYYAANKDQIAAYSAGYRAANPEKRRTICAAWVKANPEKHCAKEAKRRATKLQATPAWANQFFIEEIYDLAQRRTKALGIEHHVDHIVPLKSKLVCGLHCEANLQVLPGPDNIKKGNRFWPDMP